ncbi:RHOMBOID-like protein 12, mitochondrial isoform X2 [Macadamia integrifolia]|uniref:RHOMBOID-like protein 12, mitochondrial isoform X2 n=1 Tax=Macadamia integrifolia TaxID=60698 RepID=UPI001C501053|nr:RHOMBOID-like protein 12, mitochondrial isoform X2 [Macadamia integrifolia]
MKRLLSCRLKLVSEIPINLSHSSSTTSSFQSQLCKNFTSLAQKCPKQPTLSQPHSFAPRSFSFSSTHSWRSQNYVSEKIFCFLANPVLVKQMASCAHFKIRSLNIFDRWVQSLKAQFRRRQLDFNPTSFKFNSSRRSWYPTEDNVVLGLIVANVAIFILWRIADPTFMRKHFMISVENVISGRVHTLITSAFSHKDIGHLASNMIGLYFFGQNIVRLFGPEFLLKLYLAGAVTGSIFFLVHHAFMSPPQSAGMWSIDPKRIPGLGDSEISGSAHLGGAVVAAVAWARIKKRWI